MHLLIAIIPSNRTERAKTVSGLEAGALTWTHVGSFALGSQTLSEEDVARLFPENLGDDLATLERVAGGFQTALTALADLGPVAPFQFGTLVAELNPITQKISQRADAIAETFAKIEGHREWGLQLLEPVGGANISAASQGPSETVTSGRDYLRALSKSKKAKTNQQQDRDQFLEGLEASLNQITADHVSLGAGRLLEDTLVLKVNLSLLVAEQSEDILHRTVADHAEAAKRHGLTLRLTGPWPPQSFTRVSFDEEP